AIPEGLQSLRIPGKVSAVPMWLTDPDPLANHPWETDATTQLPEEVDTVVVALGYEEDGSLTAELKGRGVEVQSLPACSQPFLAHPASVEGIAAARRI
ncbi:MAG: hypothetical protein QGH72_04260, partial [Dehalococcoidia bacterium]|nr:hypothetical protein [Dehalococcoidia bacterium]